MSQTKIAMPVHEFVSPGEVHQTTFEHPEFGELAVSLSVDVDAIGPIYSAEVENLQLGPDELARTLMSPIDDLADGDPDDVRRMFKKYTYPNSREMRNNDLHTRERLRQMRPDLKGLLDVLEADGEDVYKTKVDVHDFTSALAVIDTILVDIKPTTLIRLFHNLDIPIDEPGIWDATVHDDKGTHVDLATLDRWSGDVDFLRRCMLSKAFIKKPVINNNVSIDTAYVARGQLPNVSIISNALYVTLLKAIGSSKPDDSQRHSLSYHASAPLHGVRPRLAWRYAEQNRGLAWNDELRLDAKFVYPEPEVAYNPSTDVVEHTSSLLFQKLLADTEGRISYSGILRALHEKERRRYWPTQAVIPPLAVGEAPAVLAAEQNNRILLWSNAFTRLATAFHEDHMFGSIPSPRKK